MLLHAVFGITAGTVEILIQSLARMGGSRVRGHNEARVGLAAAPPRQNLGLGDNPPAAAPAAQCPPLKRTEPS